MYVKIRSMICLQATVKTVYHCILENQVVVDEGDSVDLQCDESNEVPLEGETTNTGYLTSWFKLPANRAEGNQTLVARHTGQRNVDLAEIYEGRGLQLNIRDGRLTIPEVQVRDEGVYLCVGAYRKPEETHLVVKGMCSWWRHGMCTLSKGWRKVLVCGCLQGTRGGGYWSSVR